MEKIAGTAYIKIDKTKTQIEVSGDITASLDIFEREEQLGMHGVAGYSEKARAPFIELEAFFKKATFDYPTIKNADDMTITIEMADGRIGVLDGSTMVGTVDPTATENKVTIKFVGDHGEWLQ